MGEKLAERECAMSQWDDEDQSFRCWATCLGAAVSLLLHVVEFIVL